MMIRTAIDISPTISFGFRASGKHNICLCRHVRMAYMPLDSSNLVSRKRTVLDKTRTISFWFRPTGKYNICLCRYVGMAYMALDSSKLVSRER